MDFSELLEEFRSRQTLLVDTQTKSMVLLGTIRGDQAIVSLEKTAFTDSAESSAVRLSDMLIDSKLIDHNDIYYWSWGLLAQDLASSASTKVNLIYPATEKHIQKYQTQKLHMIEETREIYLEKVAPFFETQKGARIQWVYNIIFHGKESESFIYNDPDTKNGFVLLPDMKWDKRTMSALYLVAIVRRTDIASVRDLTGAHIEYLEDILAKIRAATCVNYEIRPDELRIFVHYQPSYYHFHIHVVNIAHPGLGGGFNAGKAILLDDIIDNLKLDSRYYQKKTLHYQLGEMHPLWKILNNSSN